MKKVSDDLFTLIQSLSKTEKRHFKMFASMHVRGDKNNYVKLFEAIAKQKQYDEKALLKIFAGERLSNQISVAKNYLYSLILKSMRSYHSEKKIVLQLKYMFIDIQFLFDRGLYEQCSKVIRKAKELSKKYEQYMFYSEALRWEILIITNQYFYGKNEEEMNSAYNELLKGIDKYKEIIVSQIITHQLFIKIEKKGFPRDSDELKTLQKIIHHSLFRREKSLMTLSELTDKCLCYTTYYYGKDEYQKAEHYAHELVCAIEKHPHLLAENILLYVSALGNLISCQVSLKKFRDVFLNIKKMKKIKTDSNRVKSGIFYTANIQGLFAFIQSGEFGEGIKWIQDIKNTLDSGKVFHSKEETGVLYFNIACIYFGAGNYSDANFWFNKILNETTFDLRMDVICFTQLLHLIIHFEKDNDDLVGYRVVSAERFLKNRKRLYKFEKAVFDFFRKELPNHNTQKERVNAFKKLKTEIEKITENHYERKALQYFDIISWIDSKIEGISFSEIVKKKASLSKIE